MRVWILSVGEPLPIDSGSERLLRMGITAQMLADRGHEVVWWTSAFHHVLKKQRVPDERVVEVAPNYRIQLLQGGGYRRNISMRRLIDHRRIARRFTALAPLHQPPDVIVSAMPLLELSLAGVEYARARGIPIVVDVRDLWPDIFADVAPAPLRPLARLALRPLDQVARRACAGATAIWGHAPAFVEWGLRHAGRAGGPWDRPFPFGYRADTPVAADLRDAEACWSEMGVRPDDGIMNVCFIGTVGHQFQLGTVLRAAQELRGASIRFVICGTGDRLEALRAQGAGIDNVIFAGWRRRAEIWQLLRWSAVGLAPYLDRFDYVQTIPNKVPEYLSGGLPIALSLDHGYLHDLLVEHGCGFSYANDASQLARALVELRDDPEGRKRMSAAAADLYESRFRADKVYGELIDNLERLAERGPVR